MARLQNQRRQRQIARGNARSGRCLHPRNQKNSDAILSELIRDRDDLWRSVSSVYMSGTDPSNAKRSPGGGGYYS